jgi:hypothetical protein
VERTLYDVNVHDLELINVSPSIVRECVMNGMFTSGPGLEGDTVKFMPTNAELDTIAEMALGAINSGQFIDFGYWPNRFIITASNRGGNLYQESAIGHPFSTPWMFMHTWSDPEMNEYAKDKFKTWKDMSASAYLVNPFLNERNTTLGCDFEIMELTGIKVKNNILLALGDRAILMPTIEPPPGYKYTADEEWEYATNKGRNRFAAAASNVLDPAMTGLLLLNSRGVTQDRIEVGSKLNKARIKSGKYPIPPYTRVNCTTYITAMLREKKEHQGGTHASPVPHIRKGHWRKYRTGEKSFIMDTLVNTTEEQREMFKSTRSHYSFRG